MCGSPIIETTQFNVKGTFNAAPFNMWIIFPLYFKTLWSGKILFLPNLGLTHFLLIIRKVILNSYFTDHEYIYIFSVLRKQYM